MPTRATEFRGDRSVILNPAFGNCALEPNKRVADPFVEFGPADVTKLCFRAMEIEDID
jgi:hypothetical protein